MSNIIDSIQLSGTVYTLSAQTSGGGGVPESAFTAYTAATNSRIAEDEEVTSAALNNINDRIDAISGDVVSSGDVQTMIDESVSGKVDTTTYTAYTASTDSRISEDEEVTAAGLNVVNGKFGGLKLQQITQSDYNNLQTKDQSTLYIIVN